VTAEARRLLGAIVGFVTQRYPQAGDRPAGRQAAGLILILALLPAAAAGQQGSAGDAREPLAFMIGHWEGTSEGQPGKAKVQREYRRALNSRFIHGHTRSEYPAQEKNPKGEIHEDEGWFSFDRARKRIVLRQFHVAGFVNQYVRDTESSAKSWCSRPNSSRTFLRAGAHARRESFTVQTSSRKSSSSPMPAKSSSCTRALA
jgi:hypothetical protein